MSRTFQFRVHPVDFEVLTSAMHTITLEMGITMERTSRAPIFYAAHDFSTAIFDREGNLVSLAEYIPIHICAAPFAIRAVLQYFGDEIKPGDLFLVNDPYTLDAGNHVADWTICLPVFYQGELLLWSVNRAHQQDVGGGAPGAYNPGAIDCYAEGIRIPPIKIYEEGKLRRDVFDLILANVRFAASQRGDLWSMIGSARVGERRLLEIIERFGVAMIKDYLADLYEYTEGLMRDEIGRIPDGTYHGECSTDGVYGGGPATVRCALTVSGTDLIVDLSESDGMVQGYLNSTIANTYSSVFIAVMTSVGKTVKHRSEGCMKPVKILTRPGTLVHAVHPVANGNCTNFVAKQIVEAVWDALSKVVPELTPAGWGARCGFVFAGLDPRRNESFASPDFLGSGAGCGAVWGVDGWHAGAPQIASGGRLCPEVEVCELAYPLFWEKWELRTDSAGPGRWRGGAGVENVYVSETPKIMFFHAGDHFKTTPRPCIDGGQAPGFNVQMFKRANGEVDMAGECKTYSAGVGDTVVNVVQGGCGVGNPFERDVEKVREDARNEIISVESARRDYGVAIDPQTYEVDSEETARLRGDTLGPGACILKT